MTRTPQTPRKTNKNPPASSSGGSKRRNRWGAKVVPGTVAGATSTSGSIHFSNSSNSNSNSSSNNNNNNNNTDATKQKQKRRNNLHHQEPREEPRTVAAVVNASATAVSQEKGSSAEVAVSKTTSKGNKNKIPGNKNRWLHLFIGQTGFRNGNVFSLDEFEFKQ